jgi:NitT/TauT family transport system permease protein
MSLIIVVVTEMLVGVKYGLGVRVQNVQITANVSDLFATIIIGLIGVLLNKIFIFFDRKFILWKSS